MNKYFETDADSNRLPEGIICTGYDADSGRRHYVDVHDGSRWVGAPYVRHGVLTRVEPELGGSNKKTRSRKSTSASSNPKKGRPRRRKGRKPGGSMTASNDDNGLDDGDDDNLPEDSGCRAENVIEKPGSITSKSTAASIVTAASGTIVLDKPSRQSSSDSSDTLEDSESHADSSDDEDDDNESIFIPNQSELVTIPSESTLSQFHGGPNEQTSNLPADQAPHTATKRRPMLRQITRLIIAGKREVGRLRNGQAT
ncbi:hypothetical protein CVT25_001228 [Psilocybe cyanescens]|uniref:Uncharacterized protein n=1 Tax=Psilocybe cyanescens TaxID=93625 RepID=A0A409XKC3_PSICY|nr:hypothetical protein CVT25_001228 [Psilocybe cyanescens]